MMGALNSLVLTTVMADLLVTLATVAVGQQEMPYCSIMQAKARRALSL